MKLAKLKEIILDILFPQFCLGCGREGQIMCKDCLGTIEISEYCFCPFCSFPNRVLEKGKCKKHRKMKLNGLFSATSYKQNLVKTLIMKFKYKPYLKTLAPALASLIQAHFLLSGKTKMLEEKDKSLLVPIPLTRRRLKERGFNQANLLANELSNFFQITVLDKNLIKIKKAQSQVGLTKTEREENIKDAFAIKNPQLIADKRILLVDDVFTTGATMEQGAKTLKQAGAKEVWGVVIAREAV